jgi:hypothetical protein
VTDAAKTPEKSKGGKGKPGKPDKGNPAIAYNITTKLLAALTELKDNNADAAIAAAAHAVKRIQEAGFLQQNKQAA